MNKLISFIIVLLIISVVFAADYSVTGRMSKANHQMIQTDNFKIEGEIIAPNKCDSRTSMYSIEGLILPGDVSDFVSEKPNGEMAKIDDLLPDDYCLLQNYPNPFNARTIIRYALPEAGHVRIEIYDILGRNIATLLDENRPAGYNQVLWDATDKSSGMYFYMIRAGEFSEAKKMLLIK